MVWLHNYIILSAYMFRYWLILICIPRLGTNLTFQLLFHHLMIFTLLKSVQHSLHLTGVQWHLIVQMFITELWHPTVASVQTALHILQFLALECLHCQVVTICVPFLYKPFFATVSMELSVNIFQLPLEVSSMHDCIQTCTLYNTNNDMHVY